VWPLKFSFNQIRSGVNPLQLRDQPQGKGQQEQDLMPALLAAFPSKGMIGKRMIECGLFPC
jgi:hypothetical protein